MFNPQVGRLLRKALVLAVLLASLTVVNTDSGVRKVAAQTSCCQMCNDYVNQCINSCSTPQCYNACLGRYNICRSQCSPPCS
jgi:hypothetical protein